MRAVHVGLIACVVPLLAAAPVRAQGAAAPRDADGSAHQPAATPQPSPAPAPAGTATASADVPPAAAEDRPFRRLFPNFVDDVKRLPTVDTAVVIAVGSVLGAVAVKNDEYFTEHASAGGTDQIFAVGGRLGSGFTQAGIAVGAYAIGRATKNRKTAHIGADLIRAQVLTGVLTHAVKLVGRRTRPNSSAESTTDTFSFPSGHASGSFATATVLWRHLGWKAGAPATLLAALASASRLQQNEHYMSDVLVGAAIGVASARTVTIGHGRHNFVVVPTPVAGGAAVMVTRVSR